MHCLVCEQGFAIVYDDVKKSMICIEGMRYCKNNIFEVKNETNFTNVEVLQKVIDRSQQTQEV